MWKSNDGREAMFPWGDPPAASDYAVGDIVYNSYQPPSRGAIVSVDIETATMGVKWDDGSSAITYPIDATYLHRALPWE